jgi:hypothetical protein
MDLARIVELAWAAGFFDGEGHVRTQVYDRFSQKRAPHLGLQMELGQNDKIPLERFMAIIGDGEVRGPYGPYRSSDRDIKPYHRQPQHRLQLYGDKCRKAMALMVPYLSEPKLEQYDIAREKLALFKEGVRSAAMWDPRRVRRQPGRRG